MTRRICMKVRGRETRAQRPAFTLIEMLVAMAITLVMMGAVVTLFANISNSVRNRRATIEMTNQVRHLRNVLQQDLQGATCPGQTWQRPESNHGYIEIIEGQYREGNATNLIDGIDDLKAYNPELDHAGSILPSSNLPFTDTHPDWVTDAGGLGDYDDILMLTVRNEHEPFVGRRPSGVDAKGGFANWGSETIQSPLAEVVWFAMENPAPSERANSFFGEPGMRTIYRRTLLIAPWLNPYHEVDKDNDGVVQLDGGFKLKPVPGLLRVLPSTKVKQQDVDLAIAAVIAFQDRYDVSVRAEWDHDIGHWKIVANTLGDLTKRENRFGHFGFLFGSGGSTPSKRIFAYPLVSFGSGYQGSSQQVLFANDPEIQAPTNSAKATANLQDLGNLKGLVVSYSIDDPANYTDANRRYTARPFAYVGATPTGVPATAQAMLNDDGSVVRVVHGPVPLWGTRRGEDVMMTDVLAFDLRVYDPGAPIFATRKTPGDATSDLDVVLTPSDPGWRGTPPKGMDGAYLHTDNMGSTTGIGTGAKWFPYVGQGAYVDMGYGFDSRFSIGSPASSAFPYPKYASNFASSAPPWFFDPRGLTDVYGNLLAPGYTVYDTWSFHYENDGVDEDANGVIDQGTNGLDDRDFRTHAPFNAYDAGDVAINGVDDVGERETTPPYDKPLRGMQVLIRTYERDSRAIRQVRVNQHFMPE